MGGEGKPHGMEAYEKEGGSGEHEMGAEGWGGSGLGIR